MTGMRFFFFTCVLPWCVVSKVVTFNLTVPRTLSFLNNPHTENCYLSFDAEKSEDGRCWGFGDDEGFWISQIAQIRQKLTSYVLEHPLLFIKLSHQDMLLLSVLFLLLVLFLCYYYYY